jgi:hypothetical protein
MREPCAHMRASSYSEVDAVEQRGMVNSGVRSEKDRDLRTEVSFAPIVSIVYPTTFKHLVPVIYSIGGPGGVVASGSSLVLPRAAAGTRGQHSAPRYAGDSTARYAMQGQQRRAQERRREREMRGRGKGRKRPFGLLVVRQRGLG